MSLRHEAILSLNTRVRRLRYLFKLVDMLVDSSLSRALVVRTLVDYGLSRTVYDEIKSSAGEPFSGHFFENVAWSHEKNIEKYEARKNSTVERVAEGYIDLGHHLGLLAEKDGTLSASQQSLPMRFLTGRTWLSDTERLWLRNQYTLALLLRFDRDLTGPFLLQLWLETNGVTLASIEANWDKWTSVWLEHVIQTASEQHLGNPGELIRYNLNTPRARKNPQRYAEHIALIRYHWLLDLDVARGDPHRNPSIFTLQRERAGDLSVLLQKPATCLVESDLSQIHYGLLIGAPKDVTSTGDIRAFKSVVGEFLEFAGQRGMSNIRLSLLDSVWASIGSVGDGLPRNFETFCGQVDELLKSSGIAVIKAPRREEAYIPTRQ